MRKIEWLSILETEHSAGEASTLLYWRKATQFSLSWFSIRQFYLEANQLFPPFFSVFNIEPKPKLTRFTFLNKMLQNSVHLFPPFDENLPNLQVTDLDFNLAQNFVAQLLPNNMTLEY